MNEEIMTILKMVEDGKIDSGKASELIEAISKTENLPKVISTDNSEKMLMVKVTSTSNDNVNVKVPVKFLKAIGKAVNTVKIPGVSEQDGIDVKMIMEAIDSGLDGKIVDVQCSNGDKVEVCIEWRIFISILICETKIIFHEFYNKMKGYKYWRFI